MAFQVGVKAPHMPPVTPTRCVQRLRLAVERRTVGDRQPKPRTHRPPPSSHRMRAFDAGGGVTQSGKQEHQQRGSAPPSVPRAGPSWRTVPRYQRCSTYGRAREVPSSTIASRTKIARPACASERTGEVSPALSAGELARQLPQEARRLRHCPCSWACSRVSLVAEASAGKVDAPCRDSSEIRPWRRQARRDPRLTGIDRHVRAQARRHRQR